MTARQIIDLWKTAKSPDWAYFDSFDKPESLAAFWADGSQFREQFEQLDLTAVLEIACGKGRHAAQCADRCGTLAIVDTSIDAIDACRERFNAHPNVAVYLSEDGSTLPAPDQSLTAVYSYDAMVHFEVETIGAYLREIGRVLRPGGKALLHHSNNSTQPLLPLTQCTGWRNYMTDELFRHLASRAGLTVVARDIIDWSFPQSDALALLELPG